MLPKSLCGIFERPDDGGQRPLSTFWVACLLCFGTFFLRRPDGLLDAQFFAEDGGEWFSDAYNGDGSILRQYAGYLHVLPRTVAWLSDALLPIAYQPFAYNLLALLISSLVSAWFALPHFRHVVSSDALRTTTCLLFAAWPGAFEILGTITNSQSYIAAWALLVCIQCWPETRRGRAALAIAYAITLLSAPGVLAFAPLLVLRWILDPRLRVVTTLLFGMTLAYGLVLHAQESSSLHAASLLEEISAVLLCFGARVFGLATLGLDELMDMQVERAGAIALTVTIAVLVIAALVRFRRDARFGFWTVALLGSALGALVLFVHVRLLGRPENAEAWEDLLYGYTWSLRFSTTPAMALYVWTAIVAERIFAGSGQAERGSATRVRLAPVAVMIGLFGFAAGDNLRFLWHMKPFDWSSAAAQLEDARASGRALVVDPQINPDFGTPELRWGTKTGLLDRMAAHFGKPGPEVLACDAPSRIPVEPRRHWKTIAVRATPPEKATHDVTFQILAIDASGTERRLVTRMTRATSVVLEAELPAQTKMLFFVAETAVPGARVTWRAP